MLICTETERICASALHHMGVLQPKAGYRKIAFMVYDNLMMRRQMVERTMGLSAQVASSDPPYKPGYYTLWR